MSLGCTLVLALAAASGPYVGEVSNQEELLEKGGVLKEYDRFKDTTTITAASKYRQKPLKTSFIVSANGKGPVKDDIVILTAHSTSPDWQYLRCHQLDFLVDGEPFSPGETKHTGRVGRGYVSEHVTARMSWDAFVKLSAAKKVEGRLCRTEFHLTPEDLANMRLMVRLATEEKAPGPAESPPSRSVIGGE